MSSWPSWHTTSEARSARSRSRPDFCGRIRKGRIGSSKSSRIGPDRLANRASGQDAARCRQHGGRAGSAWPWAIARQTSLLRETLDLFASQADSKAIRLEAVVDGGTSDLTVHADRDRVIQALSNLIDNAIKFSSPDGHVTVSLHAEEGEVVFSVKDDGPGIAAGHLPHIFDRFWKAEQGGKRGTGLGLYIVKGIVEAHGGRGPGGERPGPGWKILFYPPSGAGDESALPATDAARRSACGDLTHSWSQELRRKM